MAEKVDGFVSNFIGDTKTTIERDLVLNFKKLMEEGSLDIEERLLSLYAIATALENQPLMEFARNELTDKGLSEEAIHEAKQSAAIMGMLNTYYKFKSFIAAESQEHYARAGLRMQSLMKPVNGKEKFEQMAFAVSVVNGCPSCVASHEKALSELGTSHEKIHDLARLASVVKGLVTLKV
jgi:alkyl hydroperoxide reductase subunit D